MGANEDFQIMNTSSLDITKCMSEGSETSDTWVVRRMYNKGGMTRGGNLRGGEAERPWEST